MSYGAVADSPLGCEVSDETEPFMLIVQEISEDIVRSNMPMYTTESPNNLDFCGLRGHFLFWDGQATDLCFSNPNKSYL